MRHNTASYKFYWFWSILRLLKEEHGEIGRDGVVRIRTIDLLIEMVAVAFYTVNFFKLTLGTADQLERVCRDLASHWDLAPNSTREQVREAVSKNPEFLRKAQKINTYVPALFLSPWFDSEMRGISAGTDRAKRAIELSIQVRGEVGAPPYWIEGKGEAQMVCLSPEWAPYLRSNIGVLEAFVKHALSRFLHTKNPGVPAITEKLEFPRARKLSRARSLWRKLIDTSAEQRAGGPIKDIYTKKPIRGAFSIDHFLPWSFVAHDQIWNLSPVESRTNSAKGDAFPNLEEYLPALADLHWQVIQFQTTEHVEQDEYASAFRVDFKTLQSEGSSALLGRYRSLVTPQIQIAQNYGFSCDWKI